MKTKNNFGNAIKPNKNSTTCSSFEFLEFYHLILINDV